MSEESQGKPLTVRIVGKEYRIVETPESPLGNQYYGLYKGNAAEIVLQTELTPDQRADTLIHECLHGLDYAMQIGLEERQVHTVATGIYALINDNRELFKLILGF